MGAQDVSLNSSQVFFPIPVMEYVAISLPWISLDLSFPSIFLKRIGVSPVKTEHFPCLLTGIV